MNHSEQIAQVPAYRREIDLEAAERSFAAYQKTLALYHYKAMANEACAEAGRPT